MKKINVGVIGCGDIAITHYLSFIKNSKKLNLTALCDNNKKRLEVVAELFGIENIFTSHEEMLRAGLVEAVANLTPPAFHYQINLDCINAKVHTYSEKPVARKIKEIESLMEASKNNKVKFVCAPSTPLSPVVIKTKQLLEDGVIGKPCYVVACYSHSGPGSLGFKIGYKNLIKRQQLYGIEEMSNDPSAFYKYGGGAIEDLGIYPLTILIYLLGSVKYIQCLSGTRIPEVEVMGGMACGKKIKVEVDDCTLMLLEFNNGTYASLSSSYCVKGTRTPELEIYGSEGTISISCFYKKLEVYLERGTLSAWNIPYEDLSGWQMGAGLENLAECIIENKESVLSLKLAKHVTDVILKVPQVSSAGKRTLIESEI